jgi:hypothetical protein
MRQRFEFAFHDLAQADGSHDAELALMGSQGWEIRGVATRIGGGIVVALQRPLDEEHPLPERATLAATLEAPLVAPGPGEFDPV